GFERVTLGGAGDQPGDRFGGHGDGALGDGLALGDLLGADLDDAGDVPGGLGGGPGGGHGHCSSERNSMTRYRSPGCAVSTPGGIMASPFALATVEIRLEWAEPVGSATHPSGPRRTLTRANCSFSLGPETSPDSAAVTS